MELNFSVAIISAEADDRDILLKFKDDIINNFDNKVDIFVDDILDVSYDTETSHSLCLCLDLLEITFKDVFNTTKEICNEHGGVISLDRVATGIIPVNLKVKMER